MTLGLTPEHLELAAAVRGWTQRHCPHDVVRGAVDAGDSGSPHYRVSLAPSLAAQGLFGLHLPEESGGQGFGLPELAVALEETGRAMLPGAYLATVLASAVLAEAPRDPLLAKLLAELADGSLAGTVALGTGLAAQAATGKGLTVTGETGPVLSGPLADLVVAAVSTADGEAWVLLDAADLEVTALDAVDLTRPLAKLRADDVLVSADRILGGIDRAT